MAADHADLPVEQLKERLQKSETGRAKLRESLALLREKALNTGELLRQHRELQQKFQLTSAELGQEKAAREEAAAEVHAAKHVAAMTNKNIQMLEEQLRACKAQTKAAQKAANDGAAAAAKAEKAQAANRADIVSVQLQVAELQRRLQQPTATDQSGGAGGAALREDVQQLHSHVARLQNRSDAGAAVAADVAGLRQQAAAQQAELQRLAAEMARWRSAMALLSGAAAAPGPQDWVTASPSEVMLEASVREGSNVPAALPRIGSNAAVLGAGACGGGGRRGGAMDAGDEGLSGERRAGTRHAGGRGLRQAAAGESATDFEAGSAKRQRVLALVAPGRAAKDQGLHGGGGGGAESLSDPDAQLSDYTEGSLAGGEEDGTAAEVVHMALSRLTCSEEPLTQDTVEEVAQVLQRAVADGAAALASVAAGFETALLECAAPGAHAGALPRDLLPAAKRPAASLKAAAGDGASLAGLELLPFWCTPGERWPRTFAAVLRCAAALSARLQGTAAGTGSQPADDPKGPATAKEGDSAPFLEQLRAHLHHGAAAQAGQAGSGLPRYYSTEACAVAAATALLSRMQGNVQAARVFVYDMLMTAEAQGAADVLPSLGAALDAWPQALSAASMTDGRGATDGLPATAAFHDRLSALCADVDASCRRASDEDTGEVPAPDDRSAMLRPVVQRLQALGSTLWDWPAQSSYGLSNGNVIDPLRVTIA